MKKYLVYSINSELIYSSDDHLDAHEIAEHIGGYIVLS